MRFSFVLSDLKPFSVNSLYYGDGKTKTQAYYDWTFQFFDRLSQEPVQKGLSALKEQFNPVRHVYVLRLTAYYPKEIYFRKAGGISARTMDVSNWEKPFVDCLFLPKHGKKQPPYGSPNLNVDDRYITSLTSAKKLSPDDRYYIRVAISIQPIPGQDPRLESHKEDPQSPPVSSASGSQIDQSSQKEPQE